MESDTTIRNPFFFSQTLSNSFVYYLFGGPVLVPGTFRINRRGPPTWREGRVVISSQRYEWRQGEGESWRTDMKPTCSIMVMLFLVLLTLCWAVCADQKPYFPGTYVQLWSPSLLILFCYIKHGYKFRRIEGKCYKKDKLSSAGWYGTQNL